MSGHYRPVRPLAPPAALTALACSILLARAGAAPLPLDAAWARDPVWDDGLAEVGRYEASRTIYGASRPYEALLLTVKEDFDARTLVKADPPYAGKRLTPVLKQNTVREIPTPNYDYRIMTSTFVERGNPALVVKLTSGSHEWCGNTWQAVHRVDGRTTYAWSSYFDGEADGEQPLELGPGDLLEDQLPLTLRGLAFRDGLAFTARLLPSFADTHGGRVQWIDARLRVGGPETLELPAGARTAWRVDVAAGERSGTWWFDAEGTHPLVRVESPNGDRLRLVQLERRAYWKLPR